MSVTKLKKKGQITLPVDLSRFVGVASDAFGSVEEIDDTIRKERDSWDQKNA